MYIYIYTYLFHEHIILFHSFFLSVTKKVSLLKTRFDESIQNLRTMSVTYNSLEAKAQIQLEVQKETKTKLEQCNSYIMKLQNELHLLYLTKETASQNARKLEEHKEHVQDLLEENRLLEYNLSKLCKLPFIQDDQKVPIEPLLEEQIIDLETKNAQYKEDIDDLTKDKSRYEDIITTIRDENKAWRVQYDELQSEVEGYRFQKSNKDHQSTQTIELIRDLQERKYNVMESFSQTNHLFDFDCCEVKMTKVQEESTQTLAFLKGKSEINNVSSISQFESKHRDDEITNLNDQYNRNAAIAFASTELKTSERKSVQSSYTISEHVLEPPIHKAELDKYLISTNDRTMIVLDFMNYETKKSCICIGREPQYDLFIRYNMKIDECLIEELKGSNVSIELFCIKAPENVELVAVSSLSFVRFTNRLKVNQQFAGVWSLYSKTLI